MMADGPYDVRYKVLILGDACVGKTTLLKSVLGRPFTFSYKTTIGIDFMSKIFEIDGARIQLQIWDTAGQERFRTITRFYYRQTKAIILVYDITRKESFDMLGYWLDSIDKEIDMDNTEPIPVIIVGNKSDMESERQIPYHVGQEMASSAFVYDFMETSAKDGTNVKEAFERLAQAVTEINDPKLMDAYLKPDEREEKYAQLQKKIESIAKGRTKRRRRFLKNPSWNRKLWLSCTTAMDENDDSYGNTTETKLRHKCCI